LASSWNRRRALGQAIVALFAFRYDRTLVPDLLQNIAPLVDGYISWDDTRNKELWYHEGSVRNGLIEAARSIGADWVLAVDPDERFEHRAAGAIRWRTLVKRNVVYGFNFRELYTPTSYRVDGIWGEKVRWNLFPLRRGQTFHRLPVHSPWHPTNPGVRFKRIGVNLYHLKMIDERNRTSRRDLYEKLDPRAEIQTIGYAYLTDESSLVLEPIPGGRDYQPAYRDDYRLTQTGPPAQS
jgi:hypothetical protein